MITFLYLLVMPAMAQERLTYRLEYSTEKPGRIHVLILPSKPIRGIATLVIPRAIPSGYAQQFYDRYVDGVRGTSSVGTVLTTEREDGPRWRVGTSNTDVASVEYEVDLSKLEREIIDASDTSKARSEYVGILGYSVLGYLDGLDNISIHLEVTAPQGWPVFSTLAPKVPADKTKTIAEANNFYTLADSQIAMGPKFEVRRLEAPLPLFLLIYSEAETDVNKHGEIFADAFHKVLTYFGDAPFANYTAYIEILKPVSTRHEYGFSMEHLTSSTYFLGTDRAITPRTTREQIERDRYNFVHHISHSWIPKQVYGTRYMPFTWELAPQIDTIWFNEGFARFITIDAMADAMPNKEGLEFRQRQYDALRKTLTTIPEFIRSMPLLELSRVASLMYSADFRTGRTLFCKGALMAAELDDRIREQSNGKKRLRDSLRALVKWGQRSHRAFQIEELPALIAKPVGVPESGVKKIFDTWLAESEN